MVRSLPLRAAVFRGAFLLLSGLIAVGVQAAPRIEQHAIVLDGGFAFIGETAGLDPSSDAAARQLAEFLAARGYLSRVRIEGHVAATDRGADGAQQLSEARARAVTAKLIGLGVDCGRLLPVGFGRTKPVVAPVEAAGNTRIEVRVAALRGRAIGGMPEDGGGRTAGDACAAKPRD